MIYVLDKTFPHRLKSFMEQVNVNSPMDDEEKEYFLRCTERMIQQQADKIKEGALLVGYLNNMGAIKIEKSGKEN
jgi:hypothetical protein